MTVATTVEKLFKPHFGGLRFLVHKDLFFLEKSRNLQPHWLYSDQIWQHWESETQRSWPFNMHSWIGSFDQKIADPIRSDPGVSDLDLDPIQIHKNRIFDPDRGSFRSDHYTTGWSNITTPKGKVLFRVPVQAPGWGRANRQVKTAGYQEVDCQ